MKSPIQASLRSKKTTCYQKSKKLIFGPFVKHFYGKVPLLKTLFQSLPVEETSLARMLKSVGYNTAICGKWHLGYEEKFSPVEHGFDYS